MPADARSTSAGFRSRQTVETVLRKPVSIETARVEQAVRCPLADLEEAQATVYVTYVGQVQKWFRQD